MDPSRNRLASTAYFAITSSIILGGLLSGGFRPGGFWPVTGNVQHKNNKHAKKEHGKTCTFFFYPNCSTQNSNWILYILTKSNVFITHFLCRYPNSNGNKLYIYPNPIMDAFNNLGEKILWKFFHVVFFHLCSFSGKHFNSCKFSHAFMVV